MLDIVFVLLHASNKPIGGYKIIYEYANRLNEKGYSVGIAYYTGEFGVRQNIPYAIRRPLSYVYNNIQIHRIPTWFKLNESVSKISVSCSRDIPYAKNIVATAYSTARLVSDSKALNKIYFIQGFENWNGVTSEAVKASYRLGMKNIVIAKWLKRIVDESCNNNDSVLIPNGVDFNIFTLDKPLKNRERHIAMLYNSAPYKGSIYGIKAIIKLKEIFPELKATLFGTNQRPKGLPNWIKYIHNASQNELKGIYNDAQLFIYPSIEEGFGLTCVESMACGCVLCSTNYLGVYEFAVDKENALLSPIKDVDAMVKNAKLLLENDELRLRMAKDSMRSVKSFDWNVSVRMFEQLIIK